MDPAAKLAARSTSAQAVARYEVMQKEIRDQLDAAVGPFAWKIFHRGDQAGCGRDFADTGAVRIYMDLRGFEGSISDADWPRAKEIITTITGRYGFTVPTLQIDRPGDHMTTAVDPDLGANYNFGTQANTTLQVTTGCHRPS